ncbi:MAG TPA: YidC/Oxa1 family membrane protein insertase [Candidatus Bipolaricaulota bacterium]|nr:YidC/Oxa1 family membrane protein insertase [Candidatus Bipolaricaulota bacterium]
MIQLFNTVLYQPLYNLLIWLYNVIPGQDIGLAIIALTIIIKVILLPLSARALKSQKEMQKLQPKLAELKSKYGADKQKMTEETMKLYKEQKVNPLSSCLPLIIQLPFLLAVYQVFRNGLSNNGFDLLYPFVQNPGQVNSMFFGILDLSLPSVYLAAAAAIAQYFQARMLPITPQPKKVDAGSKDESMLAGMNKSMKYFMPAITFFIGLQLPGGLALYWLVTTVLTALQQYMIFKSAKTETV